MRPYMLKRSDVKWFPKIRAASKRSSRQSQCPQRAGSECNRQENGRKVPATERGQTSGGCLAAGCTRRGGCSVVRQRSVVTAQWGGVGAGFATDSILKASPQRDAWPLLPGASSLAFVPWQYDDPQRIPRQRPGWRDDGHSVLQPRQQPRRKDSQWHEPARTSRKCSGSNRQ